LHLFGGPCLLQDPHNVAALSGLAVLDLAAGETASALQRLRKAYELNRTQPVVLNILARFMVQKGDYDKVCRRK